MRDWAHHADFRPISNFTRQVTQRQAGRPLCCVDDVLDVRVVVVTLTETNRDRTEHLFREQRKEKVLW